MVHPYSHAMQRFACLPDFVKSNNIVVAESFSLQINYSEAEDKGRRSQRRVIWVERGLQTHSDHFRALSPWENTAQCGYIWNINVFFRTEANSDFQTGTNLENVWKTYQFQTRSSLEFQPWSTLKLFTKSLSSFSNINQPGFGPNFGQRLPFGK